jgi:polysaccharide biosynthesis/export protein
MRWMLLLIFWMSLVPAKVWSQGRIWEKTDKEVFPGQKTRIWGADSQSVDTVMRWDLKTQIFLLRMPKSTADYRLGPGDELGIEVIGHDEFSGSYKISGSGQINISAFGEIQAANQTGSELESKIARLFQEKRLLNNPEVLVYVIDYQAKPFYVLGEVDYPGKYWMTQELTLTEAFLMAGGIEGGFGADRYGYLHRGIPQTEVDLYLNSNNNLEILKSGHELIKVDLKPLKEGGVLNPDIPLRAGDLFFVPTRKIEPFYVIGEVKNPGGYEIPPPIERTMRASQAIARAGGPTQTAKTKKGVLIRYDKDGARVERKIDFTSILRGKQEDFEIRPKDIIFIPGSKIKTLGYGLLGIIPQTVENSSARRIQNR